MSHLWSLTRVECIVGPKGLRAFVRNMLTATYTNLTYTYVVHELWDSGKTKPESGSTQELHPCEIAGRNLFPQSDGSWEIELIAQSPAEVRDVDQVRYGFIICLCGDIGMLQGFKLHDAAYRPMPWFCDYGEELSGQNERQA